MLEQLNVEGPIFTGEDLYEISRQAALYIQNSNQLSGPQKRICILCIDNQEFRDPLFGELGKKCPSENLKPTSILAAELANKVAFKKFGCGI
jgi:hypothetical protein